MTRAPRLLLWILGAILLLALLAPTAIAAGLGRLVGGLWVTTMSAVMGLIAAMFGG